MSDVESHDGHLVVEPEHARPVEKPTPPLPAVEERAQSARPQFAIKLTSHSPPQWTLFIWSTDYDRWSIFGAYATRELAHLTMVARATNRAVSIPPPEYFDASGQSVPEDSKRRFY
jgi:hypothetical protein